MKLPLTIDIYQMYAYAGVISAGVIAAILSRICATKFRETIDRRFVRLLLFFIVFCVVDAAWGVVGTNVGILGVPVYYTATYAFHTMAALSAIAFSFYGGYYLKLTNG